MKKVDFSAVPMRDIDGNVKPVDMRMAIGNTLYMQGNDIKECELGRRIYHQQPQKGETPAVPIELDDQEVAIVKRFAAIIPSYVTREALLSIL